MENWAKNGLIISGKSDKKSLSSSGICKNVEVKIL